MAFPRTMYTDLLRDTVFKDLEGMLSPRIAYGKNDLGHALILMDINTVSSQYYITYYPDDGEGDFSFTVIHGGEVSYRRIKIQKDIDMILTLIEDHVGYPILP